MQIKIFSDQQKQRTHCAQSCTIRKEIPRQKENDQDKNLSQIYMKESRMDGNGKYMDIYKFSLKTDKEKKEK